MDSNNGFENKALNKRKSTMKSHTPAKKFVHIQGQSGEGYLCDANLVTGEGDVSEEELRKHCIADSDRPWND